MSIVDPEFTELEFPFKGICYKLPSNWYTLINPKPYSLKPIKYLEIGAFCGANAIFFAKSYGKHKDSEIHCVDPWIDHDDYGEYKGTIENVYNIFNENVATNNLEDKIKVHRGFSHVEVLKFDDEMFDIVYIDGNHEPEYVLEDAVMCFRKLKKGGIMIFDDYTFGGDMGTKKGVDAFLNSYFKRYIYISLKNDQVFIKKIR